MPERRTNERYDVALAGEIGTSTERGRPTVTQDISSSGARLYVERPLVVGEQVVLRFIVDEQRSVSCSGRILRVRDLLYETWWQQEIAVQFVSPLDLATVNHIRVRVEH